MGARSNVSLWQPCCRYGPKWVRVVAALCAGSGITIAWSTLGCGTDHFDRGLESLLAIGGSQMCEVHDQGLRESEGLSVWIIQVAFDAVALDVGLRVRVILGLY